jgi:hypothetical protein
MPVWVLNLEDPLIEMERRVAAAMLHYGITPEDIEGRLFLHSGRDRRVTIAAMASPAEGRTSKIVYPDKAQIIAEAKRHRCLLIIVDPAINSHELDENSNPQMNAVVRAWAEIAAEVGCCVLLIHHTRKGAASNAGDVEGARGAKALSDGARVALTLVPMSVEQAREYSVPASERWRYVRLDDAKQNMAAQAGKPHWMRLSSVDLGNSTTAYPKGDSVQVVENWEPGERTSILTEEHEDQVLAQIKGGLPDGRRYGASDKGGSKRWAGLLIKKLGYSSDEAKAQIARWLDTGVIKEVPHRDPVKGRDILNLEMAWPEDPDSDSESWQLGMDLPPGRDAGPQASEE